ncbi:MAG: hypothetical protein K0U64_03925 [Actinomycetia bacterium]|nr:hypothetical protein [Actinomycetes bacterium]
MDNFTKMILRRAALPTAIVGLAIAVVVWLAMGTAAGIGALLGVAVVIPFFTVGQVVLARIMQNNPAMGMTVAMMLYLAKIGVLAILLVILADVSAFDTKVFAVNILVCTLIWTMAEVWTFANTKVLYVDPDNVPDTVQTRRADVPE